MVAKFFHQLTHSRRGSTLIEVSIAMLLTTTILVGGVQFFFGGKKFLHDARCRRLAVLCLSERAEYIRRLPYSQVTTILNESDQVVKVGQYTLRRSTNVCSVDDPLDGTGSSDKDGNPNDYKVIEIIVAWSENSHHRVGTSLIFTEDYQP
jgi:hypothetical protein